jgi:predicted acyl esterase
MTAASRFLGKAMELPPAETRAVRVERDLQVPMADGAILLADRYVPPGREPTPGQTAPGLDGVIQVQIGLWPTALRFPAGHRLRLQVSSGAHPRYARNPGTGEPLTTATALRSAQQEIYYDPGHPSAMVLAVS